MQMTDMTVARLVLGTVLAIWLLLACWINYNTWLIYLAWRLRSRGPLRPALPETLPRVTVQLPVYNERTVVERLLEAVGQLDWPADLLQVQLLDDSTDDTPALAAPVIARLRARGIDATHVRRGTRDGYKAGALRDAMPAVTGEFILILDADFVPSPSLLKELIPWFSDARLAMAQGQWGRLREPRRLIERTAAYWVGRHFEIEQVARSRTGQFFHFNGSGGIWRRSAIDDAGGWTADTLAEDLDLTFRAWQKGWRMVYDHAAVVPNEVPDSAAALRIQQSRWARGAFQVARKSIPHLGANSWRHRVTVTLHLTGYVFPILMLALALTAGLAAWARRVDPALGLYAVDLPIAGYVIALMVQSTRQALFAGWRRGWLELEAAAMGIGMAPLVARAGFSGLLSYGGEFRRTPKSTRAQGQLPGLVFIEAGLGAACLANAAAAVWFGAPWVALLPLMAGCGLMTFAWKTVRP